MRLREFIINLQTEEEIVNSSIPAPKPLVGTLIELLQYQSPKRYEYRVNGKTTNTTRVNPYSPHWKLGGQ